jgi:hypothetical protein|nr:MAG TPA: hypothetical protein [Bacteriophage sp.]
MYSIKVFGSNLFNEEYEVSSLDIDAIKKEIEFSEDEAAMVKAYSNGEVVATFHIGQDWQYYVTYELIDGRTESDVIYVTEGQNPILIAKQNMPFLAHDVEVEIL